MTAFLSPIEYREMLTFKEAVRAHTGLLCKAVISRKQTLSDVQTTIVYITVVNVNTNKHITNFNSLIFKMFTWK